MHFARGLLWGVAAAAFVALPAALRASSAPLPTWIAAWGATALVVGPIAGAWRVLHPSPRGIRVLGAGLGLAAPVLMLLGEILQRGTHHRPLGAATFGLAGLCIVAAGAAVAARLRGLEQSDSRTLRILANGLPDLGILAGAAWAAVAFRHPAMRTGLLDAALACAAVAIGAHVPWRPRSDRLTRAFGPTAWVLVVVGGLLALRAFPDTQSAGPVLFGFALWIAG
jgi:hypothetical protein